MAPHPFHAQTELCIGSINATQEQGYTAYLVSESVNNDVFTDEGGK